MMACPTESHSEFRALANPLDVSPPWPARTTIKRTRRALERWIEDRKSDFSVDGFETAQLALLSVGELDQPRAEKMILIVQSARARLLTFIETFDGCGFAERSPSIVPNTTTTTMAAS